MQSLSCILANLKNVSISTTSPQFINKKLGVPLILTLFPNHLTHAIMLQGIFYGFIKLFYDDRRPLASRACPNPIKYL